MSNQPNNNILKIKFPCKELKKLGLRLTENVSTKKCYIERVDSNSIAEEKGIKYGDVIVIPTSTKRNDNVSGSRDTRDDIVYINASHHEVLTWVEKYQRGIQDLTLYLKRDDDKKHAPVQSTTVKYEPIKRKIYEQKGPKVEKKPFGRYYERNSPPKQRMNNIPENKRNRILQRRKDISYGKNTIGYDEYIGRIPKHKRKLNNMETPTTPDPEEDMPARRWQGQVRAWRKALHRYDPPGHVDTSRLSIPSLDKKEKKEETKLEKIQSHELYEISKSGLPVEFNLDAENEKKDDAQNNENIFNNDDSDDDLL